MARKARLVYRISEGEQELNLEPTEETSVGRHPKCSITVSLPSVSRRHARIFFEAGGYYVQDLDSSNGTYINGQRVHKGSLTDGDELRCGDFKINFIEINEGTIEAPVPDPEGKPRVIGTLRPRSDSPARPPETPRAIGRISQRPENPPSQRPPPRPVGRIEPPVRAAEPPAMPPEPRRTESDRKSVV